MDYKIWNGASAIIIKENKVLMVRGKDTNSWGVPSGGVEQGESAWQACIREIWEETGYKARIIQPLHIKKTIIENYKVTTQYFLCEIIDGEITYHDPDQTIVEIAWKGYDEIAQIQHDYNEDQKVIMQLLVNEL
ncbi:NUDIX hydrolase [Solibacillus sp. MA9]|uniref:NUDIX hydrolase n=1 Tax=Solibacillus palustris TaxID=2908203 RepID=A0ABS9UIF0_9BACL|nr:NUDIX hydrolase [Solibacillus sp. MA9]MCH7323904.1 NUDIX hydrolase [Solibacillus sp. MA9]